MWLRLESDIRLNDADWRRGTMHAFMRSSTELAGFPQFIRPFGFFSVSIDGGLHVEKTASSGQPGRPKHPDLPPATRPEPERARRSSRGDVPANPEIRERRQ